MQPAIALNRFGYGSTGGPVPQDGPAWLASQLTRFQPRPPLLVNTIPSSAQVLEEVRDFLADGDPMARKQNRQTQRNDFRDGLSAAADARIRTAVLSDTPFAERLVHFWANHFAVSADKVRAVPFIAQLELEAIRPHLLGRFEDMLIAVESHPAMLLYLDQARSVGPNSPRALRAEANGKQRGLNENLAREILELHTLGVRSGYSQGDVTELARALTGWTVAEAAQASGSVFRFAPQLHEPGERVMLGQRFAAGGVDQARAVLTTLAAAPATARHIATKLARHFVSDDPPPGLVERLSRVFLDSGGDLPTVYRALIGAPEAANPTTPPKFKTPTDWLISAYRALGGVPFAARPAQQLTALGQPVWRPGSPAGWGDRMADWAAPDGLLRRIELAPRIVQTTGADKDARALAPHVLPGVLSSTTAQELARAESPASALALMLLCPEFMRR